MIELLIAQRETLQKLAVTARDIDQEPLQPGLRLTLRIYAQILDDGLSVLSSLIEHLTSLQSGHDHTNRPHETDQ